MSFDNSRSTFNPWNDYFGVVMQQGRVQLDADWNEWLAEFARRIQAGTLDILGGSGVPSSTPYGFKINAYKDAAGNPHITIGTGRIYVDGFLVENRGAADSAQWDSVLAEWSGAPPGAAGTPVEYTNQPYLPGATIPGNGPFLVYLDVWQREVTYLGDSNLVDPAVGIDTTGRLQTVWQVKLLDVSGVPGGVDCCTPDSGLQKTTVWGELTAPQSSMLVTGVVPSASSGPCSLSSTTGYTGLENQLYRVEIHQGGSITSTPPATFKWSREDASVATLVSAISTVTNSVGATASQLAVQSLGRDQVLGFQPGDWVEIIDDYLELNPPVANNQPQPGELHLIDSIDPVAMTITLDSPVSSTSFPVNGANQTDPSRHTRIRRWDQPETVYLSDGATVWPSGNTGIAVPPPGVALILENGITVAFEGSSFQAGSFWIFAARTSDGSVEIFNQPSASQTQPVATIWNAATAYSPGQVVTSAGVYYVCSVANSNQAPPNPAFWSNPQTAPVGIYHHYRRLATVDFGSSLTTQTDCRRLFQPLANPAVHVKEISLGPTGTTPLQNDSQVTVQSLATGITIFCDVALNSQIITQPTALTQSSSPWSSTVTYTQGQVVTFGGNYYIGLQTSQPNLGKTPPNPAFWAVAQFNCPICFVTADLPIPTSPPSGGFNPFILSATVTVNSNTINWTPTPTAVTALLNQLSPGGPPLLARLTLKGNFIWANDDSNIYLNGAFLGVSSATAQQTNSQLPSGDGRRSADFEMWFWLISQPAVTLSPIPVNFVTPQVVGSSGSLTVTLTNNSTTTPLTFPGTGITVGGLNPGDFKATNTCGTTVAPGASCTITVTFTPTAAGSRIAQLNIQESADTNPLVIALTGTGIQPLLSASSPALTFPAQTVGTVSLIQTIVLTNPGSSQLNISNISIEGTDYSLTTTCTGSLQPNQQCTISVQFEPTTGGTRSAELQIQTNASNVPGGTLLIPLTGTGVPGTPGANVSPTSLAFGTVTTGSRSTLPLALNSTGNAALSITAWAIIGTNANSFSQTNACGGTLQPTQQCSVTVTFAPTTTGALSAALQITTNAEVITVPLSGTGSTPKNTAKDITDVKALAEDKIHSDIINDPGLKLSASIPAEASDEGATKSAFISSDERPPVGS
jgi:hypothetical protein